MIRKAVIVVLTLGAVTSGLLIPTRFLYGGFRFGRAGGETVVRTSEGTRVESTTGLSITSVRISYRWFDDETICPPPPGTRIEFAGFLFSEDCWPDWAKIDAAFGPKHLTSSVPVFTVQIPLVAVFVLSASYPAIAFIRGPLRRWRRRRRAAAGHCQECDYDLTGNVSGVCPECGTKIELGVEGE